MSSANRERRQRNRAARTAAVEDSVRRARRQRVTLTIVGLALALVVAIVLVARATDHNGSSASATTTTTSIATTTTSTTLPPTPKRCVAMKTPPAGTPVVPILTGPPPKKLVKLDLTPGTGAVVKAGATVTVDYVGVACSTGKVFGSSYGSQPLQISLTQSIQGWQRGVPGMRVGGTRLLAIPPGLGYGPAGTPDGTVGPNETLWFLVKVDKVDKT